MVYVNYIIKALLLFLLVFFSYGCENHLNSEVEDEVRIRIENSTELTMNELFVSFPQDNVNYGDLSPGETSEYVSVEEAYRYAYIETVVDGKQVVLQPIDFVGEELLEPGRYTYVLFINTEIFDRDDPNSKFSLFLELRNDG